MTDRAGLIALLAVAGVEQQLAERLSEYGCLLLEANRRVNLTGAESPEDLLPHLLDSLTVVPYVREPLIDIGSGGGLPAIPVAIATGSAITMVESTRKKAAFLERAAQLLGIEARIFAERAETAGRRPELRDAFGSSTARAVSSAPTVLELSAPFLRPGGTAVLQRGNMDERERNALADAAPMLGAAVEREVNLDGERRIVLVRKLTATPPRFPRRIGIPEKRPLCL